MEDELEKDVTDDEAEDDVIDELPVDVGETTDEEVAGTEPLKPLRV